MSPQLPSPAEEDSGHSAFYYRFPPAPGRQRLAIHRRPLHISNYSNCYLAAVSQPFSVGGFITASPSLKTLLWLFFPLHCSLPDSLVRQPASITLLVPILVGSLQLLRSSNDSAVLDTGLLCFLKVQGVPCGDCSVVEHDAWKTQRLSLAHLLESNQCLSFQRS